MRTALHVIGSFALFVYFAGTFDYVSANASDSEACPASRIEPEKVLHRKFIASTIGLDPQIRKSAAKATIEQTRKSLEADENNLEQHYLHIIALGAYARASSTKESMAERLGSKSKKAIEKLEILAPDKPWTDTLHGVWHIEAERRGGFLASMLLGASKERGVEYLEKAMEADKYDAAIPFVYATALFAGYAKKESERGLQLISDIKERLKACSDEVAGAAIKKYTQQFEELLLAKKTKELEELAQKLM